MEESTYQWLANSRLHIFSNMVDILIDCVACAVLVHVIDNGELLHGGRVCDCVCNCVEEMGTNEFGVEEESRLETRKSRSGRDYRG